MNDIIGHDKILNFFSQATARDVLSHAYCFVGPTHVGKRTVAEAIAADLFGTTREKLHAHPDMLSIERTVNEKTGKLRKDISIEQIRDAVARLQQKPFLRQPYKIAIIDHAELMSVPASNALLKTLEEPNAHTIIFLITSDEDALLPTIRSRSQMIFFSPVERHVLAEGLQKHTMHVSEELLDEVCGLPGRAVTWLRDRDAFDTYKQEIARFSDLCGKPLYEKLTLVETLFDKKDDHISGREDVENVLQTWQIALRQAIRRGTIDAHMAIPVYERIRDAQGYIKKNIHPRLLVEHILLALP